MTLPTPLHTRISIVARDRDRELDHVHARLASPREVDSRGDLADQLGRALTRVPGAGSAPATLDLIAHSTSGAAVLRLGDWVIDAAQSSVLSFFRELGEHEVLPRLGIDALRLLGSVTARSAHGRYTICAIADLLGVEVYGTTDLVWAEHFDAGGFSDRYAHVLVPSRELRGEPCRFESRTLPSSRGVRALDLDALPSETAPIAAARELDSATARDVLRMIRRTDGVEMPGLLAAPSCTLALPGSGGRVRLEVLLAGELVRVFPRDVPAGILYPVADAIGLRRLLAT